MINIENTVEWITGIVTAASVIAAVTPTPKDDGWLKIIYSLIDLLAVNIGKAKER